LKVFRGKFVNPSLAFHTQQIAKYASIEGLLACDRFIVTPQDHTELLRMEPDLLYAVVMAWIEGPTWLDLLIGKRKLTRKMSHAAAYALAQSLAAMEQRGLAHGDLSAPNVMLPIFAEQAAGVKPMDYVQLVDLEQMYASHLDRPEHLPAGSPGYAPQLHPNVPLWGPLTDRFAGAVLLMEMLGACADSFYEQAWGESYFSPDEMQQGSDRYRQLVEEARANWGDAIASLFIRAWESQELSQCPAFGEWLIELAKLEASAARPPGTTLAVMAGQASTEAEAAAAGSVPTANALEVWLKRAKTYEERGKFKEAIHAYRSLLQQDPNSSLAKEIEIAISSLEDKQEAKAENKRGRSKHRQTAFKRAAVAILLIGLLGGGGYYAYDYLRDFNFHAQPAIAAQSLTELQARIHSLEAAAADDKKTIEQLNKRIEELGKPLDRKNADILAQLSQDYERILQAAALELDSRTDPSQRAFEAAQTYMSHWYAYLENANHLDSYLMEQLQVVAGYYYPFQYNDDRNAQLNIRFFNDYKTKFTGGDSP